MTKLRVLIVDDSVVARQLVRKALEVDPEIEVCGTASNGKIAIAKIDQMTPDLVTLDIEMPIMSGLKALPEIRRRHPSLPVVMFSAHTEKGAMATMEALSMGASDYICKPTAVDRVDQSLEMVRATLIPKIKALCRTSSASDVSACSAPVRQRSRFKQPELGVDLVAIASSTGGPVALTEVLPLLPADLAAPVVIVQHMPPAFTPHVATRLDSLSKLSVREGTDGAPLRPGTAWIAPGGFHMEVVGVDGALRLRTHLEAPENSCRPAADPLFRSVARHCGPRALGVVLTGMGQDGLRGCEAIHESGGRIVVQDEATSVVWGMPGFVAKANLADSILPLSRIAAEITRVVRGGSAGDRSARPLQKED